MILPLAEIDVHDAAAANPDYTLTMQDVQSQASTQSALRCVSILQGCFVEFRYRPQ
jgi:hypothetical protein